MWCIFNLKIAETKFYKPVLAQVQQQFLEHIWQQFKLQVDCPQSSNNSSLCAGDPEGREAPSSAAGVQQERQPEAPGRGATALPAAAAVRAARGRPPNSTQARHAHLSQAAPLRASLTNHRPFPCQRSE